MASKTIFFYRHFLKRYFVLFSFLLFIDVCQAQKPGDSYAFQEDYAGLDQVNPFTKTINTPANKINMAERGDIFTIRVPITVGVTKGYIIVFWNFKKFASTNTIVAGKTQHIIDISDNGLFFFIPESVLIASTTTEFNQRHGWLNLDAIVLPIKLRFKNKQPGSEFDFSQSFCVGPALSFNTYYGGPFGKVSTSVLFGFNVTNVAVDEKTAPGAVDSKTTLMGLSPFVGYSLNYKGINISVLSGIDILTGKAGQVYSYRNSPWIGFSLGGSIFNAGSKEKNK